MEWHEYFAMHITVKYVYAFSIKPPTKLLHFIITLMDMLGNMNSCETTLYTFEQTIFMFSQKPAKDDQQPLLSDDSVDESDTVDVIFDDKVFPTFTVQVVTNEEQDVKENVKCHCSEQSLVGSSEVQEWKVQLDDDWPEADEPPSSDTTDRRLVASPDNMTDHHVMLVSPHIPPSDSVTLYSLSETNNVEVSYTFHLKPTKH